MAAAWAFVAREFKGDWPSFLLGKNLRNLCQSPFYQGSKEKDLRLTLILLMLELSQHRGGNPPVSRMCF